MVVIRHHERSRLIPTDAGTQLLQAWVQESANAADKSARVLHVKSVHTARGFGAKALSFVWLDIPFRAVGGAVRAAYQAGRTCPAVCRPVDAGHS
jgi:hypothetical protein